MIITHFSDSLLMSLANWAARCGAWEAMDSIDDELVRRGAFTLINW